MKGIFNWAVHGYMAEKESFCESTNLVDLQFLFTNPDINSVLDEVYSCD
jgi:hypothetical protein